VGNTNDVSAEAPTGFISTATGSFDPSLTNVTTVESDYFDSMGMVVNTITNAYTLQVNTNFFNGSICSGAANPASQCAWEQFVYENDGDGFIGCGSCGFIQYWLIKYNNPCPAGWMTFMFPMDTDIYCYQSSVTVPVPSQAITNLGQLSLSGVVSMTGDSVHVGFGGMMKMMNGDNAVDAVAGWQIAEFNVFGDADGSRAVFNNGAKVVPRTQIIYGGTTAPTCVAQGFTGETNNLSFALPAPAPSPPGPALIFTESTAGGATSNCMAGTTVGDTHLNTFSGLFYDFQASGDFVMAQSGPNVCLNCTLASQPAGSNFVVQARQVSGAPQWPNAAVNQAIATQMGQTTVAVCPTLGNTTAPPAAALVVNGAKVAVGDGSVFSTPDGVDIWHIGNVYTITDQSGNSVRTEVNPTWMNVSVGLGQWPVNVSGPLANVNGNVNQIATSGGTVLTAPFAFEEFYQNYAQSWRVAPGASLLSVCGGAVETGIPQIPFYAINLDPQLYQRGRTLCTAAGVQGEALLDACTLDDAVIGNDTAAQVFVNARQPVAVGNIILPNQLTITTASLATGVVGVPYSQTLNATGGTPPYIWTITSGRLPAGLSLNAATGQITGIPTFSPASSIVTLKVTDSSVPAQTASVILVLTIE
jgi:hypothetical protein